MLNHLLLPAGLTPVTLRRYRLAAASLFTLALHGALLAWLCYRAAVPPPLPAPQPMVMLAVASQAESVAQSEKLPTGVRQQQAVAQAQPAPPPQAAPKLVRAEHATEQHSTSAARPHPAPPLKTRHELRRQAKTPPQSVPSQAAPAPDTTAPPPLAGKTLAAPHTRVAAQPSPDAQAWSGELLAHLSRYKRYPAIARRQQREGVAQISVTLDRQGRVLAVKLLHASGVSSLDKEATELPLRASPLPAPPQEMAAGQQTFSVSIPLRFDLRELRG